jgi:PRTRC genetic system protein C
MSETLEVKKLKREFKFTKDNTPVTLPDPNPEMTIEEVMQFYAGQYPELTTAQVEEEERTGNKVTYRAKTSVGTKG